MPSSSHSGPACRSNSSTDTVGRPAWSWRKLFHPYLWDEESIVIRRFLDDGWLGALHPVQGYLILPTTLLLPLAAGRRNQQQDDEDEPFAAGQVRQSGQDPGKRPQPVT